MPFPPLTKFLLAAALTPWPWIPIDSQATATWYGNQFIGCHHAAYWHSRTPVGFTPVVDTARFGVAAPSSIPFGTKLRITRICTCWGEPRVTDGRQVVVTVVDRRARSVWGYYDLWPAPAEALDMVEDGCIKIQVDILAERGSP